MNEENEEEVLQQESTPIEDVKLASSAYDSPDFVEPEDFINTPTSSFAAPFNSEFGNSSVDLSMPENEEAMMNEYREWFHLGRDRKFGIFPYNKPEFKEQRNQLKDKWYQKYYGMDFAGYLENKQANAKTIYGHSPDLKGAADQMDQNFQALMVPGLAYADFANDALGTVVPGYNKLDDRWDEKTKLDNPLFQNVRRILSVVLPAIHTGGKINQTLTARGVNNYPWLAKNLTRLGAHGLADGTIAVLSDTSEDDNAAKVVADMLPGLFGPKGRVPFPESWKTSESNSPAANKAIHFFENFGLAGLGTILGAFIDSKSAVKTPLDFFEPLDEVSAKYKQLELFKTADSEDLIRLQELNTLISSGKLNRQTENQIINEIIEINERLGQTTTLNDLL